VQFSDVTTHPPAAPQQDDNGWNQAGFIIALNQMALQGSNP
jgi:hypothetical protein